MQKKLPFLLLLLSACTSYLTAQTIQTTFLTQSFQGTGLPPGWSQTTQSSDGGWKFGNNLQLQSTNFQIPAHTKFACTNDDACNCNKISDRLITDTLHLAAATAVVLKFDYYFLNFMYDDTTEQASVEVSTDGGINWQLADTLINSGAGWRTTYMDLTALAAGHASVLVSFKYSDKGIYGDGLAIDNVSLYQPVAIDAAFTAITPVAYSSNSYGLTGSNVTLGGTITNLGATAISTCTIKWSDGTTIYPYTFNTSIPRLGTASFTHNQHFNVAATGGHPVKMWVELANDTLHANDTLNTVITGATFRPVHKTTIEDQTVCSSGFGIYSPRGIVRKEEFLLANTPNYTEIITVHWKGYNPPFDPLYDSVSVYALAEQTVFGTIGWPEIHVDRKEHGDVDWYDSLFAKHNSDFGMADLTPDVSYDSITREVTVNTVVRFAVDVNPSLASYNLALVLTEDSVHNTDTLYSQRNAYANNAMGPMAGGGIDFAAEPNPVSASKMYYMNVARKLVGPFKGIDGSLPATLSAGSTWTYTFPSYTVPVQYNAAKMRAIVLLVDTITHQVRNSNGAPLIATATGISNLNREDQMLKIFPNPFSTQANVLFKLDKPEEVSMRLTNLLGETIAEHNSLMPAGEQTITINGKNLSVGMYLVTLKAGNTSVTKRVVINR